MANNQIDTFAHVRAGIDEAAGVCAGVSMLSMYLDNGYMTGIGAGAAVVLYLFGKATDRMVNHLMTTDNEYGDRGSRLGYQIE